MSKTPQWRIDQLRDLPPNEANCSTCTAKISCIHNKRDKGFYYGFNGEVTGYVTHCSRYEGKYKSKSNQLKLNIDECT